MAEDFSRARAWALLNEYTQGASLLKHALCVETCMAARGERQAHSLSLEPGQSAALVERYRITGLLHDFDYERYPSQQEHPFVGVRVLAEQGWPEEIRTAILGHALYSGVPRETHLARALFACDELSGLYSRRRGCGGAQEDERQGLCARRKPGRHRAGRSGTGRGTGRADRLLPARHASQCRGTRPRRGLKGVAVLKHPRPYTPYP